MKRKGTQAFVETLKQEGVDILFGYPGGYAVDLFDALYGQKDIEVILPRHEQGLIHEADGYARSTGKVGVCLVTSGPGATNLVTGIATANYDSIPLVCFTGQVSKNLIGNDAFQEVDIVGITRSICKYAITVRERKGLVRIIKEAFYIAKSGKPGPVLVDIPKDIQLALFEDDFDKPVSIRGYKPNTSVHMGQLKKAMDMLDKAKRPVFLAGGGVNIAGAGEEFTNLVNIARIPVVTTIMGKGAIPTDNPYYVGNVGMHGSYASNMAISECDLLFSIGTRFNDRITGKISEFAPNAAIIHIDIEASSISRNIKVDVPIVADAKLAIQTMLERVKDCFHEEWNSQIDKWKLEHTIRPQNAIGLTPDKILKEISARYQDGIIVTDVGQHQMWTTQYLEMNGRTKLLTSGGLGTMGFGLPAAIGAKLGNPDKQVVCISGDGGMQMNIQEMATAVTCELPITFCIFNNSYLGMVRQFQQLFFNKRYSSTCLRCRKSCEKNCFDPNKECPPYSPDFIQLANSYQAKGIRVFKQEDIKKAFELAASNKEGPTIIEFMLEESELVLPMVPGGNALNEMILDC
ncbi:biosynthetic-type acetolactate synthase large subunit [Lachnotalea glycerini]|uniref:Acetolactate synthase n=1 Tax=Lachnotalea glycerini TaxID=1763509 RepID=A0A371JE49_9FIRM|nr:biosynthetic-type acetolactate synthase large subunit [Lachnotalea glycerini]RDY31040.1 biosynthetic-type acetolactate synthase large subunit [Lachnotalea glycerini]